MADSDYRFFPTMPDEMFGYVLHPVDLAMNKVVAAAERRELRDIVDLVMIHETILPLGAVIWEAVEKEPGFTPEGLTFLKDGRVVQRDPDHLDEYETHAGRRQGEWPSSPEIAAAMFERYETKRSL